MGALAALLAFSSVLLLLEVPLATSLLRLGRHLEIRLRLAFLEKSPASATAIFKAVPSRTWPSAATAFI